jgi:DNA-binding FadR family transcriptional regulator
VIVSRVERQSVADQVFGQLLDAILSGEQPAGSVLPSERDLAATAGVNRQAVREALQRLRQMDLIEIVHGGGATVLDWRSSAGLALLPILVGEGRAIEPGVARSIMELRQIIGAHAARACADRDPAGVSTQLDRCVAEMAAIESDPLLWGTVGFRFWDAIVNGADNIAYRLAFNTLRAVGQAVAPLLPGVLGAEWLERDLYSSIAAAVAAGDGDEAETTARRLLGRGVQAVDDFFANAPAPGPLGVG